MVRSKPTPPPKSTASDDIAEVIGTVLIHIACWVVKVVAVLAWWAFRHPVLGVPIVAALGVGWWGGWRYGVAVAGWSVVVLWLWMVFHRSSFRRWVVRPISARWRKWKVYRHRWAQTCALNGLTSVLDESVLVPRLRSVHIGAVADIVTAQMLPGQSLDDWDSHCAGLATAFGARAVTIGSPHPQIVELAVTHADSLATPILLPVPIFKVKVDLAAVVIGVDESGEPWRVRLAGRHILIAGATGAGKGSIIWSLLAGIAPAIGSGVVSVRVIDPKGGMELGAGVPLFDRFAYTTDTAVEVLRDAAAVLSQRAERLRGHTRTHTPTAAEPLIVVVIDELAALTAYVADRKVKTEIEQLLGLILSQGRAVGVSVVAAVQDPSKNVLDMRQLFPTRIALRLTEATQVAMVLGQSARERGAVCDRIPDTTPGIGYVAEEASSDLIRVRAFHVTDPDIDTLTATYGKPEQ